MHKNFIYYLLFTLILLSQSLLADETIVTTDKTYNMALKGGTLGLGIDISSPINNDYALRFNLNGLKKSHPIKTKYNTFKGDFKIYTAGILLDYYPIDTTFRMSAGIYANSSKYDGKDPGFFTDINVHATYNKIAPYLGIGWGNNTTEKGWGFTFDIGALYQGKADVRSDISLLGMHFEVKDELDKYTIIPVVAIGVNYTF